MVIRRCHDLSESQLSQHCHNMLGQYDLFARRLVAANERREREGDSDIQYPSLSYVLCSSRLK